ncbi:MAG: hypothetical protein V7709_09825 [Halioglobus sp.]
MTPEEGYIFRKLAVAWFHRELYNWLRGGAVGEEMAMYDAVNSIATNLHAFKGLRGRLEDRAFSQLGFTEPRQPEFGKQLVEPLWGMESQPAWF